MVAMLAPNILYLGMSMKFKIKFTMAPAITLYMYSFCLSQANKQNANNGPQHDQGSTPRPKKTRRGKRPNPDVTEVKQRSEPVDRANGELEDDNVIRIR